MLSLSLSLSVAITDPPSPPPKFGGGVVSRQALVDASNSQLLARMHCLFVFPLQCPAVPCLLFDVVDSFIMQMPLTTRP